MPANGHVGDVDLAHQDAGLVAAGFVQQAVDVAQHFAGLAFDVLGGVFGDLAGQVDGAVVDGDFGQALAYVQTLISMFLSVQGSSVQ
jgi:hypothetical protein